MSNTNESISNPSEPTPLANSREPLLDRQTTRIVMFVVLFGVTGFLGLPALWFSRSFTTKEKIFWSIVNTFYTLTLIAITAAIVWWALRPFFSIMTMPL